MRKKHKANVLFRVALILLCLVLFSAHLSSGMLAKYTTEHADSYSSRVAKTGVTISSASVPLLGDDGSAICTIHLKNDSEVAVEYSLVVTPSCEGITAAQLAGAFVNPKIDNVAGVYDAAVGSYTFSLAKQVVPGEEVDHTLSFDTNDIITTATGSTSPSYKDVSLMISAKTIQIH